MVSLDTHTHNDLESVKLLLAKEKLKKSFIATFISEQFVAFYKLKSS